MLANQATYKTPASCGELLQGVIQDSLVLISCPVNIYNTVTVRLNDSGVIKCIPDLKKSRQAVINTLKFFGYHDIGAEITVSNPMPKSKGLGSSTSDVTSSIAATAKAIGEYITPDQIAALAVNIEPSDATMFHEMVLFAHRSGNIINTLGELPSIDILAVDFGGIIDTVEYNTVDRFAQWKKFEKETENALNHIKLGITNKNVSLIGKGATINTITSNKIDPNPNLEAMLTLGESLDARGVSMAHSGTIISLLFDPQQKTMTYALKQAKQKLEVYETITHFRSTQPGPIEIK